MISNFFDGVLRIFLWELVKYKNKKVLKNLINFFIIFMMLFRKNVRIEFKIGVRK